MTNCGTFTLSDLTEKFFTALCYVEKRSSSGLGGSDYIRMITETGQENNMVKRVYSETKKQWDKEEQERLKAEEKKKRHDADEKNQSRFNTDVNEGLTFRNLRNYLSFMDRLSICMLETLNYENYMCIEDVPHTYDDYYVYGIGMIDSEFYKINKYEYAASGDRKDLTLATCIEVMLAREPKGVLLEKESEKDMGKTEK